MAVTLRSLTGVCTAGVYMRASAHTGTRWSLVRRLKAGGDEQAWQEFNAAY